MKDVQLSAIVLLALMSLSLAFLLPRQVSQNRVANRSRWLLSAGFGIMSLQFVAQYVFGFRAMGITYAVIVNLAMFIPASALLSLSLLNLQRQGRISRFEWLAAIPTWLVAMGIITTGTLSGGKLAKPDSTIVWSSEIAASFVYALMQFYYCYLQFKELKDMELKATTFYDNKHSGLLRWMELSVGILAMMALTIPMLIFAPTSLLAPYSLVCFIGIFYVWFCFVCNIVNGTANQLDQQMQKKM